MANQETKVLPAENRETKNEGNAAYKEYLTNHTPLSYQCSVSILVQSRGIFLSAIL